MEVLLQHNGYFHVLHAVLPPWVAKIECLDVGALQADADGLATFGVQSRYRAKAREAFVRWECGERFRRAAVRKATPVFGSYQVGDIVSYCRKARAGEHGLQWSVGSRLIGFEKDTNSHGETQPRTCWVICGSVPVCVAIDGLRPCTPAEFLAFTTRKPNIFTFCSRRSDTTRLHRVSSVRKRRRRKSQFEGR